MHVLTSKGHHIAVLLILILILTGCGDSTTREQGGNTSANSSTYEVLYVVRMVDGATRGLGTNEVEIEYCVEDPCGSSGEGIQEISTFPATQSAEWRKTVHVSKWGLIPHLRVRDRSFHRLILTCEIYLDGELADRETDPGSVSCDVYPGPPPLPTARGAAEVEEIIDATDMSMLGVTRVRPADGMQLVFVPAGTFKMGSDENDPSNLNDAESPVHEVTLDGFWIDQTEVTNRHYNLCVDAGICTPTSSSSDTYEYNFNYDNPNTTSSVLETPVVSIDWFGAETYCNWVGGRLPTEAEWEYAARGPQALIFPWGDTFDPTRLNYCDINCRGYDSDSIAGDDRFKGIAPAGSFPSGRSWVGADDMAGNAKEWVQDWYSDDYYDKSPETNPTGPETGEWKILRGGNFDNDALQIRSAFRSSSGSTFMQSDIGFRCVVPAN